MATHVICNCFFLLLFKVFGIILIASCILNGGCYPGVLVSIPFSHKKSRSDLPVTGKVTTPGELRGNLIDVWQGWNHVSGLDQFKLIFFSKFCNKYCIIPCWSRARLNLNLNHRNGAEQLKKPLCPMETCRKSNWSLLYQCNTCRVGCKSWTINLLSFSVGCFWGLWCALDQHSACHLETSASECTSVACGYPSSVWKMGRVSQRLFPFPG